jgi:hypothetical protein
MKQQASSGMGFGSVIFVVFLVLKLVGVINWSWWLIALPLLLPVIVDCVLLLIGLIILFVKSLLGRMRLKITKLLESEIGDDDKKKEVNL